MRPNHILVTGGSGFTGAHLICHLLSTLDAELIINLDLLSEPHACQSLKEIPHSSRYQFVHGDICDPMLIEPLLKHYSIDTIIHCASESLIDQSIYAPVPCIQTNIVGTLTLLEAARHYWLQEKRWGSGQCLFHHLSTDKIYGSLPTNAPPFIETAPYNPTSPYAASRAAADHLVRSFFKTYRLPITISCAPNLYGLHQHNAKLIPTIIRQALHALPITLHFEGKATRDWLYIEDYADAIHHILDRGVIGESYHVSAGEARSMHDVAMIICQECDRLKPRLDRLSYKRQIVTEAGELLGYDFCSALNADKIRQHLDWRPKHSLESGLKYVIVNIHEQSA